MTREAYYLIYAIYRRQIGGASIPTYENAKPEDYERYGIELLRSILEREK